MMSSIVACDGGGGEGMKSSKETSGHEVRVVFLRLTLRVEKIGILLKWASLKCY